MIKMELKGQSYKFRVGPFHPAGVDINIKINIQTRIKSAVVTSLR